MLAADLINHIYLVYFTVFLRFLKFCKFIWTMTTMLEPVTHGPCGREVPIRAGGVMPCLPSMAPNLTEGQSTQGGEGEARGGGRH